LVERNVPRYPPIEISKPHHLNRSITLSIIDEISGASADISAFIVQLRRALDS
jgi:hypothetical protein